MPGFVDHGVKCGNCKQYHESSAHVKLCYTEAKAEVAAAAAPVVAATEKQEAFLRKLLGEREHGWDATEEFIQALLSNRKATSGSIDLLLSMPKASKPVAQDLEDGIYRTADGTIYKVYHTVHGANVQVAKELIVTKTGVDENGKPTFDGTFEYMGKRPLAKLTPAMRLTQDEAKQFGLVYSFCINCTRDLTREESIHVGYGPTCAKNNDWWYPTKVELKALKAKEEVAAQVQDAEVEALADYCSEPF